jgi:hypothetical protein
MERKPIEGSAFVFDEGLYSLVPGTGIRKDVQVPKNTKS